MLSLLDTSAYSGFDGTAMNLDNVGDPQMSQRFSTVSAAQDRPSAPGPAGKQRSNMEDRPSNAPGAGAGPLPAKNPGAQPSSVSGGGRTLTEFMKRRNWAAKVVEELKDILQIVDANGRIKYVSPSIRALAGYAPEDVLDCFLQDFIHPDDIGVVMAELHESMATGNQLRLFYRLKKKDGNWAIFEALGHAHVAAAKFAPNPSNQSPFCQAIFMVARPYPTKNAGLLDSFLEHKIENERLKRRIAELREEEAEDAEESQRTWRQSRDGVSDTTASQSTVHANQGSALLRATATTTADSSMPPPDKPSSLNPALTKENLEGVAGSRSSSIREKMARYEAATHADTIEMLTGLRYSEGERSRGITTGNTSPALIKGDVGIAIPVDRDPRTGEKKKKLKVAEEYVCTDCGKHKKPQAPSPGPWFLGTNH